MKAEPTTDTDIFTAGVTMEQRLVGGKQKFE
jgi:hypothetical protein